MVTIYTQPGCSRSRRLRRWLKENEICYREKPLFSLLLEPDTLKDLMDQETLLGRLADEPQSQPDQKSELRIKWIQDHPSALHRPLAVITEDTSLQQTLDLVGYLGKPENQGCTGCQFIPVCSGIRKDDSGIVLTSHSYAQKIRMNQTVFSASNLQHGNQKDESDPLESRPDQTLSIQSVPDQ